MKCKVIIADSAIESAMGAYAFIHADSPSHADMWLDSLLIAIDTLEQYPKRCPVAPEAEAFSYEVRHLLHGAYRVLFTIHDREVRVFHVRHGSRSTMNPDD